MKKVCFFILFTFLYLTSSGQDIKEILMKHWSNELGLASDEVSSFAQDYKGFIWIGTSKGLNRFDGQSFLTIPLNYEGIGIEIQELLSYRKYIYVYTNDDEFFQINPDDFEGKQIIINNLKDDDLKNSLLQLTDHKSVFYENGHFQLNDNHLLVNGSEIDGDYNNFYKDSRHRFWVSSVDEGIGFWDSKKQRINYVVNTSELASLYFNTNPNNIPSLHKGLIIEDNDGRIWFYRDRETIGFWDYETDTFYTIKNIKSHPYLKGAYELFSVFVDIEVRSLFVDNMGSLWIGSLFNGMFRVRFKPQIFQFYEFDYSSKTGLADEDISCPIPLNNGDIWIGTWGGGINILKSENLKTSSPEFRVISPKKDVKDSLQDGEVFPIFEDSKENIWVGSNNSGLQFLSKEDRKADRRIFKNYNKKKGVLISDSIMNVYEDSNGVIWISTTQGLTRYLPDENKFESKFKELKTPKVFESFYILCVYEDSKNNLWVTTQSNGLFIWNRNTNELNKIENFEKFTANSILSVVEYPKNSIWLAGVNGLYNYNLNTLAFGFKAISENLPTDHIESMILGTAGLLWLGTDKGLFTYDASTKKVENIDLPIGIRINKFTRGVSKDKDGYLYFGTRNGFYRIHPNKLLSKETIIPTFTDLKIDGVSYRDRKNNKTFNQDISSTTIINLNYNENTFSVNYRNLDYYIEDKLFYETSMTKEGEKENWTTTYDTSKSWIDLNDGNYTFKVRKRNGLQTSNLHIIISPPWWRSKLAIGLYVVFFIILFSLLNYFLTNRKVNKEKKLQSDSFDKLRFKFFLNIAHEIRTPLTLINGGLVRLKEGNAVHDKYTKELDRVFRNTGRLTRMVNEVLDLKKIERTEINLNVKLFDLKWFLENIVDIFNLREKEYSISLNMPKKPVWIKSDQQLLESIIYNLISNAIKYSNKDAVIEVSLFKPTDNKISVQVKDNGYGIKKEEQQLVFERLYQSEEHLKTGTGIGLAIVKQYVELLKGSIDLKSELNEGSTFTIMLPFEKHQSGNNDGVENESMLVASKKAGRTLLIVDDQKELRSFIKEIFEKDYNVFEAANGKEGLSLVKRHHPSLVISDVMMPVMNGVEFSKKVRNDISISHIPIVLLTAKTGDEAVNEGLLSGADAYVIKPFNQKILKSRVEMLIENRKILFKKYSHAIDENLSILASNNLDREFLKKFDRILTEQFAYSDLSMEELASDMAVSTSSFYTKIKSFTGSSPLEFVRVFRLKKAATLLKTTNLTVTEISERVGFGTQKYFSNTFKKYYEETPLSYRKKTIDV